ncbi:MAG: MFS transporter, partial [Clostridiales bacterium]|nr:MFS transporter [Candidatus Crickella merdequi]
GIWMITIYTLAYAASIPVMGKLADRMGRRTVYLVSIFLFGLGSLLCGFSHGAESFSMLIVTRALQAIGGGGIVPIANAEFGTTFPEEKRGMALGMVGGVYGIANIFGASAGSLVLDLFGTEHWEFIFYVNVPIAIFILIAGYIALPNTKEKSDLPIDGMGTCLLVVMVLSLMYGLKNIDFFDFKATLQNPEVYGFLLAFAVLLPAFIFVEKRAKDPVMNLKYFSNFRIVMTLLITIITGIVMMGVVFVPQFCENALMVPSGNGGYFVIILGICAGVGAMSSGKMTDKYGPRLVLGIGFVAAVIGAMIVIFFSSQNPNRFNVFASLVFIGLGIGFTMGAPLNYMMLGEVDQREANSALATLSLVRSLGTVVAPAIMVGFIANAGGNVMGEVMKILPNEVTMPELPYAEELWDQMEAQGIEGMPDYSSMKTVKFDMTSTSDMDIEIPDTLLDELKNADVTTITSSMMHMADYMFDQMVPAVQDRILSGLNSGIDGISSGLSSMNDSAGKMKDTSSKMQDGINGMNSTINKQNSTLAEMTKGRDALNEQISQMENGLNGINSQIAAKEADLAAERQKPEPDEAVIASLQQELGKLRGQASGLESAISQMKSKRDELQAGIAGISSGIESVTSKRNELSNAKKQIDSGINGIESGILSATDSRNKMLALRNAIPGAFQTAKEEYLASIRQHDTEIKKAFQSTLNVGFRQIFVLTAIGSILGILLLLLSAAGTRRRNTKV